MEKIERLLSNLLVLYVGICASSKGEYIYHYDVKGTSIYNVSASEFSNWKRLYDNNDCHFRFSNQTLNFVTGSTQLNFSTKEVSLLYESNHYIGDFSYGGDLYATEVPHMPASEFHINEIAVMDNSVLGEVKLIYIGNQSFVNQRAAIYHRVHIMAKTSKENPTPVINISAGFFVLIKQKRKSLDKKFIDIIFNNNYMIASESLSSDEVYVIGDLENFISKRDTLSNKTNIIDMSGYIPKDVEGSYSETKKTLPSPLKIEETNFVREFENPVVDSSKRGTVYVFDNYKIKAFTKDGKVITATRGKVTNHSSHAEILKRQLQSLNDNTSMVIEDPYEALVKSIKLIPAIVDKYFEDNPSLNREEYEEERRKLLIESTVPKYADPNNRDVLWKAYHLFNHYGHLNDKIPKIFRMTPIDVWGRASKDENGIYIKRSIVPFIITRQGNDIFTNDYFLSSDIIHMQAVYFNFMNFAEYLDRNRLVTGGTLDVTYDIESGHAQRIKLINDKIYSLVYKGERFQMTDEEKKSLSEFFSARLSVELEEDILTDD